MKRYEIDKIASDENMAKNLIGKTFQLVNLDNSIMTSFIIGCVKIEKREAIDHSDGSRTEAKNFILVGEKEHGGFYRVYGEPTDRIF